MDLAKLIDLAEKYDYKPDDIHLSNLNEFIADNASSIASACKDYATLQQKLDAMAAENAALKKFCKNAAFDADYIAELEMDRGGFTDALNDIKTPTTDACLNSVRAEGIHFAANLMLAAWESGFIDDTPAQVFDISGAVLTALEFLPNATVEELKRDYADEVRASIAAQLRTAGQADKDGE